MEIVLGDVLNTSLGALASPNIMLFKHFRENGATIHTEESQISIQDRETFSIIFKWNATWWSADVFYKTLT